MDPLSIIVSAITITGALRATIRKAQDIKHAQPQIHALANELSDLTIMLLELEKCLPAGHSPQNPQFVQALMTIRNKLNGLAEKIGRWVDCFATSSVPQDAKVFNGCVRVERLNPFETSYFLSDLSLPRSYLQSPRKSFSLLELLSEM